MLEKSIFLPNEERGLNDNNNILEQTPESKTMNNSCDCVKKDLLTASLSYSFIYAIGKIEPRFPSLDIEKEFKQATGRADTSGQTDRQSMHSILSNKDNRYLLRQLCWVLRIEGIETYLLQPQDSLDLDMLIESLRPVNRPTDIDVVIGLRGPLATPEICNGLLVPIVTFDQIYSFDIDSLVNSISDKGKSSAKRDRGTKSTSNEELSLSSEDLFLRIIQMADNAGAIDEHRALNYLSVRYDTIYTKTAERHRWNYSLASIDVRLSNLSSTRKIVDVIFSYRNRNTDVMEKYYTRVDVTGKFPFLVTQWSVYIER